MALQMKHTGILLGLLCMTLVSNTALAQADFNNNEVFGGFSYLPAGPEDFPREASYGFQAGIARNFTRWFGLVLDFGAQYGSSSGVVRSGTVVQQPPGSGTVSTSVYEYLAGPRFTLRTPKANVFAHFLVGGASGRTSLGIPFSDTELAIGAGAGVDVHLTSRIAIRAVQFDYLGSFTDMLEDNVRVGAGIVFKF
jgi:hypothetical protein